MNRNKVYRKRRQKLEREKLLQEEFKRVFAPHIEEVVYSNNPIITLTPGRWKISCGEIINDR